MGIGDVSFDARNYVDPVERTQSAAAGLGQGIDTGPRQATRADTAGHEIAMRQADRTRGQQLDFTGQLQQAAAGEVPSVAAIQQQQGLDAGLRQSLAMANSARGGSGASLMAARGAQDVNAQMAAQGVQNASMLRAQEMAQARGQLGQHLAGMQASDQAAAGQQLQLALAGQQAGLTQQQLDDARMLGVGGLAMQGATAEDRMLLGQQQLASQQGLGAAGLNLQAAGMNAEAERAQAAMIMGGLSGLTGGIFNMSGG